MSDKDHERIVDTDPEVLEGEDEFPREPAAALDPYTPDPGPHPGEERAFKVLRLAWIPIAITVLVVVIAFFR